MSTFLSVLLFFVISSSSTSHGHKIKMSAVWSSLYTVYNFYMYDLISFKRKKLKSVIR